MRNALGVLSFSLFVLLAACSSDDSGSSSSGGSSSGGSSGGNVPPADPYTLAPKAKTGAVNVFVHPESPGETTPKFYVAAYFLDYSGGGTIPDSYSRAGAKASDCTIRKAGSCELVKCKLTDDPSLQLATPKYASAGDITVERSSGGEQTVPPDSISNQYLSEQGGAAPATEGETATITAAGAEVPAFSETLPFIEAAVPSSTRVDAKIGADTEIAWTGGGAAGKLLVAGEAGQPELGFVARLECRFDAAAKKGTIPSAVLVEMANNDFAMTVAPDNVKKQVGDYEVLLHAERSADLVQNGFTLAVLR